MLVHDPTESRKRPMRIWERRKKSILKASSFIERSTENKKKMVVTWQQRTHCAIKLLCTLCRSPLGFSIVVSFLLSTFSENCTGLHRSQTTNESVFLSNPIEKKKQSKESCEASETFAVVDASLLCWWYFSPNPMPKSKPKLIVSQ